MAATYLGKVAITGISTTFAIQSIANYVSPDALSGDIQHTPPAPVEIKDQEGAIKSVVFIADESLRWEVTVVPWGTNAAEAAKSCSLPTLGATVAISGMPQITLGGFANALNANWAYVGGGRVITDSENRWTLVLPLQRWKNITLA